MTRIIVYSSNANSNNVQKSVSKQYTFNNKYNQFKYHAYNS